MGWSEERVVLLRKYWAEGLSATQIARQLGGVTRNAVIGKVHRLGLMGRATPSRPAKRFVRPRRPPRPPRLVVVRPSMQPEQALSRHVAQQRALTLRPLPVAEGGRPLGVLDLQDGLCRFPIGCPSADDFAFCGRWTKSENCPYCTDHATLCYQPSESKRRRAVAPPDEQRAQERREAWAS